MPAIAHAVSLKSVEVLGSNRSFSKAISLLASEWTGMALDFTDNTYITSSAVASDYLLGASAATSEFGLAIDMASNTYSIGG